MVTFRIVREKDGELRFFINGREVDPPEPGMTLVIKPDEPTFNYHLETNVYPGL